MKTVQNIEKVTVKVSKDELIDNKWLHYQLLSKKLGDMEKTGDLGYKSLRNRLYNSAACGKYNMEMKAGLKCIDIENPMKAIASLALKFERV